VIKVKRRPMGAVKDAPLGQIDSGRHWLAFLPFM
jgi:hypothetical protein